MNLSSFDLKILALLTMLIDHIGFAFYPDNIVLRIIGRTSFILYAFLLVEGFMFTSNVNKYILRLLAFGLLSEVPYDLLFTNGLGVEKQNVFFTLALAIHGLNSLKSFVHNHFSTLFVVSIHCLIAELLRLDYGSYGILVMFAFYFFRESYQKKIVAVEGLSVLFSVLLNSVIQIFAFLAFIPIFYYNGAKGKYINKYLFYLFYPVHLLIIFLIKNS